jgi:5-methylthioadenosine/S-adenosylhomocysteine deaminase
MEHAAPPLTPHLFDLLLLDAIALTADPRRPELRDCAIGISNGRIAWLDRQPPERFTAQRTLRLPGHFVTPGFVNPHTHSVLTMVRGVAADLGFAPSYTPGIPKGTSVTPAQARALARLGALEALLFGSTVIGDNFVHADVGTEAMVELGVRLCPSWRIHDVDFARVAHGDWHHDTAIGRRTLDAGLALHARWAGHPRVRVNLAAHAVDTCSDDFLQRGRRGSACTAWSARTWARARSRSTGCAAHRPHLDRGAGRTGLLNERLMGGHCIYVSEGDAPEDGRRRRACRAHPKCNATSGRLAPTPMLQRAGVNMALATDTQHGDMVELMRWALVTARVQEGGVDDGWQPRHVFHMATMGGAQGAGHATTRSAAWRSARPPTWWCSTPTARTCART